MIAIDLSKQQPLGVGPKAMRETNFTANIDCFSFLNFQIFQLLKYCNLSLF